MNLLPGSLLSHLAAKTVIHDRVKEREVDLPNFLWLLSSVLLIPHSKHGLIGQVHWSVNVAFRVFVELDVLKELVVDGRQRLTANVVVEVVVHKVRVIVVLSVYIRTVLHKLWLGVFVDNVQWVRAIVEVLSPVNADVVCAWDVLPVIFVFLGQS